MSNADAGTRAAVAVKGMNGVGGDNWGTIFVGLGVALLAGLAWGILNGFLVAKARIPPLIVTLGTLGMSLGAALLITGGGGERDVPFKLVNTNGSGGVAPPGPHLLIIPFAVAL